MAPDTRVNCVAPGFVPTHFAEFLVSNEAIVSNCFNVLAYLDFAILKICYLLQLDLIWTKCRRRRLSQRHCSIGSVRRRTWLLPPPSWHRMMLRTLQVKLWWWPGGCLPDSSSFSFLYPLVSKSGNGDWVGWFLLSTRNSEININKLLCLYPFTGHSEIHFEDTYTYIHIYVYIYLQERR